jgi:alkylation response protein AidB-like acyl-CoA dehydrogenase
MEMMKDIRRELKSMNFSAEQLEMGFMLLDVAQKFATTIEPMASRFDQEGIQCQNGQIILPQGMEEIINKLGESGILGTFIPQCYGGGGLPYTFYAIMIEIIAAACPCIAVAMAVHGTAIDSIMELGTPQAKEKYLPLLAQGKMLGAIAFTEANAGSDVGNCKMTAELSGEQYILNGTKQFITNGGKADLYIVLAATDKAKGKKGLSAFIVEKTTPGFSIGRVEEKLGIHASPTTELILENCPVSKDNLLGIAGKGLSYVLRGLTGGRIEIAAQAVGIAQAAYQKALQYSQERVQFGQPICSFQAIQFKLADMIMGITAARKMYLGAAYLKDQGEDFVLASSMAKLFASEMAKQVADQALQIHGGYGYIREYEVERHYRDARITTIYEGTSEIQRIIISREILGRE